MMPEIVYTSGVECKCTPAFQKHPTSKTNTKRTRLRFRVIRYGAISISFDRFDREGSIVVEKSIDHVCPASYGGKVN